MAIRTRKQTDDIAYAMVLAHNLEVRERVNTAATYPHADITSVTSADYKRPNPTTLAIVGVTTALSDVIALAENARAVLRTHFDDAGSASNLWGGAHKTADATNKALLTLLAAPLATNQATVNVVLNAEKAAINAHVGQATVHFTNDGVNSIVAADATDLASSKVLAAAIKSVGNAHIIFAGTTQTINLVEA